MYTDTQIHLEKDGGEDTLLRLGEIPTRINKKPKMQSPGCYYIRRISRMVEKDALSAQDGERWLKDNLYYIQRMLDGQREISLPPLPEISDVQYGRQLRIHTLSHSMVEKRACRVDAQTLSEDLSIYLEKGSLTLYEWNIFKDALLYTLLSMVEKMAEQLVLARDARRAAVKLAGALSKGRKRRAFHLVATWAKVGGYAFLEGLGNELNKPHNMALQPEVDAFLQNKLDISLAQGAEEYHREMAALGVRVANAIQSMRALEGLDFATLYREFAALESILITDVYYPHMDEDTQWQYREAIGDIALKSGMREEEIAHIAQTKAQETGGHMGSYLLGKERPAFYRFFGVVDRNQRRKSIWKPLYFSLLIGGSILAAMALTLYAVASSGHVIEILGCLFFGFLIFFSLFQNILNRITAKRIKPAFVPKMGYDFPDEAHATAVVMPVIATEKEDVQRHFQTMLSHYHALGHQNVHYVLLCDLYEADKETAINDEEILFLGRQIAEAYNQKYAPCFSFCYRDREYAPSEKSWMGFDRKRGALNDLNDAILGKKKPTVHFYGVEDLSRVSLVLTLDADTMLPPDGYRKLINAMMHPVNQELGYFMMQPMMVTKAAYFDLARLPRIYAAPGLDFYGHRMSELYMDLTGYASFSGKGIYWVKEFQARTQNAIEPGTVLSHDLLESCLVKTAFVSDIQAADGFPGRYTSWLKREHRWMRGDWQLLPYIFGKRLGATKKRLQLSALSRFKMLDNLRRSLLPVASAQFFIIAVTRCGGHPLLYTIIAFCPYWSQWLLDVPLLVWDALRFRMLPVVNRSIAIWKNLIKSFTSLVFCAYEASLVLDAIIRTLYRLIRKQRLLQWITADQAEKGNVYTILGYLRVMWVSMVFNLSMFIGATIHHKLLYAFLVVPLWVLSPVIASFLDRGRLVTRPDGENEAYFRKIAADTYSFYADYANAKNHFLAPDNVQQTPKRNVIPRTSPTNMGFTLLSHLSAKRLGLIDETTALSRIQNGLESIDQMEKWNGHLYNWYDTANLEPLSPRYVSTVDSGNLAASLLAVYGDMASWQEETAGDVAQLAYRLFMDMDFSRLFDGDRKLFSIGYDPNQNQNTRSYYDLYASEIRLTSLIAMAKGDVPEAHFRRMGRPLNRGRVLSWSGTMFEYLTPSIFITPHQKTFERLAIKNAIKEQMRYAKKHHIPFGISESGFYAFDGEGYYQYKAFGMEGLSVRALEDRDVVSPYSSLMAAMVYPEKAIKNLKRLERLGARGQYGFFEAVDFAGAERGAVVKSFMAHHQGMALCSLTNLLEEDHFRDIFARIPMLQPALLLFGEASGNGVYFARQRPDSSLKVVRTRRSVQSWQPGTAPHAAVFSSQGHGMYLSQNGTGGAIYDGFLVYRRADDGCLEQGGLSLYIQTEDGENVSPTLLPGGAKGKRQCHVESYCMVHTFSGQGLETAMQSFLSPQGTELRLITIKNNGKRERKLTLVAAMEPVLEEEDAYASHPAFHNLFLGISQKEDMLLCHRRPRYGGAPERYVAFRMAGDGPAAEYCTDKAQFLGNNGGYQAPKGLSHPWEIRGEYPVNPIMAGRKHLVIPPQKSVSVVVSIATGAEGEGLLNTLSQYSALPDGENAVEAAKAFDTAQLSYFHMEGKEALSAFQLAGRLLYGYQSAKGSAARARLFAVGVSGDLPVVAEALRTGADLARIKKTIDTHAFLSQRNVAYDLIICDLMGEAYSLPERQRIREMVNRYHRVDQMEKRGGIHLVQMDADGYNAILSGAYTGKLGGKMVTGHPKPMGEGIALPLPDGLEYKNAYGGFSQDGREYHITLSADMETPAPWSNVMANEQFGCLITERGGGYTFYKNSREYKLTPFTNDPVSPQNHEALYLRDEKTGRYFCPLGGSVKPGYLQVNHGFGYSSFSTNQSGLSTVVTVFVHKEQPAKIIKIQVKNRGDAPRELSATYVVDWVLSRHNAPQKQRIVSHYIGELETIAAYNAFEPENLYQKGLLFGGGGEVSYLLSREAVYGVCASQLAPLCMEKGQWPQQMEEGDGGSAYRISLSLSPGEEKTIWFVLGACQMGEEAHLPLLLRDEQSIDSALLDVKSHWEKRLSQASIHTGTQGLDIMLNGWLPYQVYVSRFLGRAGFYQAGGAFGYRDQLQDAMALCRWEPAILRTQILRAAGHQFTTGDVQHWWHEPARGVRTKMTDDLLFLPYAACHYVEKTGDISLWQEAAPYLGPRDFSPGEDDIYYEAQKEGEGSVLEHCIRAINLAIHRTGSHGLPLIGTGDWNDGMNRLGRKGKGESVWLGFFLYHVLDRFLQIAGANLSEKDRGRYASHMQSLSAALDATYTGDRFLRAYTDDGTPIGNGEGEAGIDLISQAWAALSGAVEWEKANTAMDTALQHLWDKENGLLRLLWPPFDETKADIGYIKGYAPGIRENGGQYTHGALWGVCALCALGRHAEAEELFHQLLPALRSGEDAFIHRYRVEPYVIAADVYSTYPNEGRGGWTWYTGSAGWAIRTAMEWLYPEKALPIE
ncbi:hypothetical protein LJC20_05230 [Eubacteriales bacterium OttesenSCG-928-M02]|nr:hypothetical protein [Eubacteriales bacterium OttesenSCG-928-M02]